MATLVVTDAGGGESDRERERRSERSGTIAGARTDVGCRARRDGRSFAIVCMTDAHVMVCHTGAV